MRDIMQYELPQHALDVWERIFLPTTSSRILPLQSGKDEEILSVVRSSEAGDTEFRVTRLPDGTTGLIELSSSRPEVSWSSYHDTQKSSRPMRCPSYTSVLTEQPERLEHIHEETTDGNTSAEWLPTPSISDTTLGRMVFGSLRRIISSTASIIRRTTN